MRRAWRAEFTDYVGARSAALLRTAYLLCSNWHRAEDIVQTSLVKLYVAWPRARAVQSLDAYARQIVVRTFLDERRRMWHREIPTAELPDDQAVPVGFEQPTEDRMVVMNALAEMPPRQRAVLVLRYFEDFTVEQAAEALGCSEGTVKSQTSRGLAALRAQLERNGLTSPVMEGQRS